MPVQNRDAINYSFNKGYDSNNWMERGGTNRYNRANDLNNTFNKQAWEGFFSQTVGKINKNPYIGFVAAPKVGNESAFGKFLQLVSRWSDSNSLISDMSKNENTGNLQRVLGTLGGNRDFGPSLEYISKDNYDISRVTMTIADYNDARRTEYKFTISQGTVSATALANGQNPATATEIASNTTIIELTPDNNFFGELANGCLSCKKDSCGKGYRTLYFSPNYFSGGYPQGDQMGKRQMESVLVWDAQFMPNGNLRLEVERSANGRTGVTTQNNFEFIQTAIPLQVGDFVFVGSMTPSTSCIDFNLNCDVSQPKQYQYCVGTKTFVDCVGCIDQDILLTRRTDELLSRPEQLALSFTNNYRTSLNRVYNDLLLGEPNAYQNHPLRKHGTLPIGNEYDGELMPENVSGLLHQHDLLSKPLELEFKGCELTCNEYILKTILDALENGIMDTPIDVSTPYDNGQWYMVGDTGALKGVIDARKTDFQPNSMDGRIDQLKYFYTEGVSIFSSQNTSADAKNLSNQFKDEANRMGISIDEFQLGKYKFKAIYDQMLAYMEPGVIRLWYIPDIHFFTDCKDEMTQDMLGMQPYLPATAIKGRLIPSIISKDLASHWINGDIKNMVRDNCGFQFFSYMRAGVYLSPNNMSRLLKIRIVGIKENPRFAGGTNPLEPEFIKVPYWELGCGGCALAMRNVAATFETWDGFKPVNAQPYTFGERR